MNGQASQINEIDPMKWSTEQMDGEKAKTADLYRFLQNSH
jgi:hypothetical protein